MVSTERCRRLASRGRAPNATQLAPSQEPSDAVPTGTGLTYLAVVASPCAAPTFPRDLRQDGHAGWRRSTECCWLDGRSSGGIPKTAMVNTARSNRWLDSVQGWGSRVRTRPASIPFRWLHSFLCLIGSCSVHVLRTEIASSRGRAPNATQLTFFRVTIWRCPYRHRPPYLAGVADHAPPLPSPEMAMAADVRDGDLWWQAPRWCWVHCKVGARARVREIVAGWSDWNLLPVSIPSLLTRFFFCLIRFLFTCSRIRKCCRLFQKKLLISARSDARFVTFYYSNGAD
jgi:hypothetical protein